MSAHPKSLFDLSYDSLRSDMAPGVLVSTEGRRWGPSSSPVHPVWAERSWGQSSRGHKLATRFPVDLDFSEPQKTVADLEVKKHKACLAFVLMFTGPVEAAI